MAPRDQQQAAHGALIDFGQIQAKLADFPIVVYEAGDVVLHESSSTNRILILQRGTVEIVKDDVQLARISEPGAVFGEMGFILGRPHTANVYAVGPSSFFVIKEFAAFLQAEPDMARYLMVVMAERLDAVNHLLIDARAIYQEAQQQHGMLDEVFARIGRALHFSAR